MKKQFLFLSLLIFTQSCVRNNTYFCDEIRKLEDRITIIKELTVNINEQITDIEKLITVINERDYITAVNPVYDDNDTEIGYEIVFNKQKPITIYHGKEGSGSAPVVLGVALFEGRHYWTVKTWSSREN